MSCSTPVPSDHPLMIAWNAFKETEDFANGKAWSLRGEEYLDGAFWTAFMAGFQARNAELEAELATAKRDLDIRNDWRELAYDAIDQLYNPFEPDNQGLQYIRLKAKRDRIKAALESRKDGQ